MFLSFEDFPRIGTAYAYWYIGYGFVGPVIETYVTDSKVLCTIMCFTKTVCTAAEYDKTTNVCTLKDGCLIGTQISTKNKEVFFIQIWWVFINWNYSVRMMWLFSGVNRSILKKSSCDHINFLLFASWDLPASVILSSCVGALWVNVFFLFVLKKSQAYANECIHWMAF